MTPDDRIDAALAFLDRCEAMTVTPESWAGLSVLDVVHRMARSLRGRLDPPPVSPRVGAGPTEDYAAARAAMTTTDHPARDVRGGAETEED